LIFNLINDTRGAIGYINFPVRIINRNRAAIYRNRIMSAVASGPDPPFIFETFRFHVRMRTLTVLPPYKGAVFRGALDNAFRKAACPFPRRRCDDCSAHDQCLYLSLFQPSPPADFPDAGKFGNAPPPYVIKPSPDNRQAYHPRDTLDFDLTLIGRALDALPYFIFAVDQIGRRGLGRERGRYELSKVVVLRNGQSLLVFDGDDQAIRSLPPAGAGHLAPVAPIASLTLELQTPLRIKKNGKLVTRLDFSTLFNSLTRRLTLLSTFYGQNGSLDLEDLSAKAARMKTVEDQSFWYDWPRYSSRQKELMKLGGLRGSISFEGDFTPFMRWLRLGEAVHVGQGTTFGLGGYAIQLQSLTENSHQQAIGRHRAE
jgi:CRISPR-associated endoribonuclease Cas6